MEILRTACFAAMATAATFQSVARPESVVVTAVTDGQTISVAGHGRVRLAGIEAPRLGRGLAPDAAFGREARERLEGIVIRRFVRLEFEPGASRRAYVLLEDGTFVNAVLVREGLARAVVGRRPAGSAIGAAIDRREQLRRAQEEARALRRGIWGTRQALAGRQGT
jgi:micrococcal nuclease